MKEKPKQPSIRAALAANLVAPANPVNKEPTVVIAVGWPAHLSGSLSKIKFSPTIPDSTIIFIFVGKWLILQPHPPPKVFKN